MLITALLTQKKKKSFLIPVISMINYPVLDIMLNKNFPNPPIQLASAEMCI